MYPFASSMSFHDTSIVRYPPVADTLSGAAGSFVGFGSPITSFDHGLLQSPLTERAFIVYFSKFKSGLSFIDDIVCVILDTRTICVSCSSWFFTGPEIYTSYPVTFFCGFQDTINPLSTDCGTPSVGMSICGAGILFSISLTKSTFAIFTKGSVFFVPVILIVTRFTAIWPPKSNTSEPSASTSAEIVAARFDAFAANSALFFFCFGFAAAENGTDVSFPSASV